MRGTAHARRRLRFVDADRPREALVGQAVKKRCLGDAGWPGTWKARVDQGRLAGLHGDLCQGVSSCPRPKRTLRRLLPLCEPRLRVVRRSGARQYSGGPLGLDRSWDGLFQPFPCTGRRRPSSHLLGVGDHISLFEACSTFTRITTCLLAELPSNPFISKAPTDSLPPHVASIASGRSDPVCRAGLAPAEDPRLFTAHASAWPSRLSRSMVVESSAEIAALVGLAFTLRCVSSPLVLPLLVLPRPARDH